MMAVFLRQIVLTIRLLKNKLDHSIYVKKKVSSTYRDASAKYCIVSGFLLRTGRNAAEFFFFTFPLKNRAK